MDSILNLLAGFQNVTSLGPILGITIGVCIGVIFGAIPGISGIMAVAIVMPFTFYLGPIVGITILLAIYKAGIYGGSISAILINTPGSAPAFLTAQDGYSLTRQGKSAKALAMALYASVTGEMLATLVLVFVAAPVSLFAIKAGPLEKVAILIFAFSTIGSMTGETIPKGLLSCCIGMFCATIGMSTITGATRFTFGITDLMGGLTFLPLLMGVLVMPEVVDSVKKSKAQPDTEEAHDVAAPEDNKLTWREYRSSLKTILKSTGIGTIIGAIPGLGSSTASFLAYGEAKRSSKDPKSYGKGSLDGIAAAESANNAVCGSSMIPMLTLSIPGDDVTALLMGAFLIHGITPGPNIFVEHTDIIYTIFAGFLVTDFILLFVGRLAFSFWTKVSRIPSCYIFPCITVLTFVGTYTVNQSMFDILVLICFTFIGYGMKIVGLNPAALIIGFILTPLLERNLDQSMSIIGTNYGMIFQSPIVWAFALLTILSVYMAYRTNKRSRTQH